MERPFGEYCSSNWDLIHVNARVAAGRLVFSAWVMGMTELNFFDPPMRRLFVEIDLASSPLSGLAREASDYWHTRCGANMAPSWSDFPFGLPARLRDNVFLFAAGRADGDYSLVWHGEQAFLGTFDGAPDCRLDQFPDLRLAVRLRRVLDHVRTTREPMTVRFPLRMKKEEGEGELFLAPVRWKSSYAFFGVLTFRTKQGYWQ
jgi:hypothetical protein